MDSAILQRPSYGVSVGGARAPKQRRGRDIVSVRLRVACHAGGIYIRRSGQLSSLLTVKLHDRNSEGSSGLSLLALVGHLTW